MSGMEVGERIGVNCVAWNLETLSFALPPHPLPPPNINDQPLLPPPHKAQFDPVPNQLRTLYKVLHMRYRTITISFYDCNVEIIFVSDEICVKMPQKPNFDSKKIQILGENGINSKLKHRKAHYSILSRRFADPYGRRLLSYPGELACMIITLDN